jgi:hypothetical protein
MKPLIITNNPLVYDKFSAEEEVLFDAGASQLDILMKARDRIHLGAKLVIHPMMGRIKPHETPYKSVFMEVPEERELQNSGAASDFMSIQIIEDSIHETQKFLDNTFMLKYSDDLLPDLQFIDYILIKNGMEEYR